MVCLLGKETSAEVEMTIPGLDWGMEEVMQKDQKKVPQKKVPYAKPIPAQFQQVPLGVSICGWAGLLLSASDATRGRVL